MSLDTLKSSGSLNKLLDAAKGETKPQEKKSYVDERLWKPELDKSGNGYAVLRFLPAVQGEDLPWAKVWNHAFQGPTGQWYIENSLTTLNQKDPVSEHNTALWNTGLESDKEIARKQKRKLQYFSNVYVVSDTKHPENEGKVFLFRYGKKIFDKITAALSRNCIASLLGIGHFASGKSSLLPCIVGFASGKRSASLFASGVSAQFVIVSSRIITSSIDFHPSHSSLSKMLPNSSATAAALQSYQSHMLAPTNTSLMNNLLVLYSKC